MRSLKLLFLLVISGLSIMYGTQQGQAQESPKIELENVVALVDFGEQITFVATMKSPVPIRDASIIIEDGAQNITHSGSLIVHADGRTEFRFDTRQNILRPFSPLTWKYRFTLADGSFQESITFPTRYDDTRFDWQTLESGMLLVHWYGSGPDFGQTALNAAQAGLESVSRLLPVELDRPVDFYIYASLSDLRDTLVPGSQEWVAGHADPTLGVVMVAIEPGPIQDSTMKQRIPHELMHVMIYRAVDDGYRNIPAWLSEGTAGLAELVANVGYDPVLRNAVARNDWIPMSAICSSFHEDADRAFLAYAESRSFVSYLYEKHSPSEMLNLALVYANGANCEDRLAPVLGDSLVNLEEKWHKSLAGQDNPPAALENTFPYLVLLGLILIVPVISIVSATRRKGNAHGPETYIRR